MAQDATNGNLYANVRASDTLDMRAARADAIAQRMRVKYGMHNGHFKWDLAVAYFTTDNDTLHRIYGFNFVPTGRLFTEAKLYVAEYKASRSTLRGGW